MASIHITHTGASPHPDTSPRTFGTPLTPHPNFEEPPRVQVAGSASLEGYVRKRRELLEILNSFQSLGTQSEVEVPQIVVLGSQSVGKSTLLEHISGIELPRNAGTCTRCPIECRLQNFPTWSCQLSIRVHRDARGMILQEPTEVRFGGVLTNVNQVEPALRRAQAAVLNPNIDYRNFLSDYNTNNTQINGRVLMFSEDCVCIHVKGPDVPDLYFYDLPGIIANLPDGSDERDISLVENLARKYIERENCIVLLVVSCETDFENQGAARLILNDLVLRDRTIGVLTKVDKLDDLHGTLFTNEYGEAATKWMDILMNKIIPLRNGWFAVRQSSQQELHRSNGRGGLSSSRADVLHTEQQFFSTKEPWRSLSPRYQQRLGSSQLSNNLSTILSNLVERQLPSVPLSIARSLHDVKNELDQIPQRNTDDPRGEVIKILCDFAEKITEQLKGLPPTFDKNCSSLMYAIDGAYRTFRLDVHRSVPRFRPWKMSSVGRLPQSILDGMTQMVSQDDAEDGNGILVHVDEVMDLTRRRQTCELLGSNPYSVRETLIREFTNHWNKLMNDCFEAVEYILTAHVNMVLHEHFANYAYGGLLDQVNIVIQQQIRKYAISSKERLDAQFKMECEHDIQNEPLFYDCRDKYLACYKSLFGKSLQQDTMLEKLLVRARIGEPLTLQMPIIAKVHAILKAMDELGIVGRQPIDLGRLLPHDNFDPALEIMAEVRAYFQVTYKRFADVVPQIIDDEFVRAFGSSLEVALHMMDISTESYLKFLEEAPDLKRRRQDLTQRKMHLEAAKDRLERLFISADSSSSLASSSSSYWDVSNFASPTLTEIPMPLTRSPSRSTLTERVEAFHM